MTGSKTLARKFFSVVVASFIGLALFMVSPSKVNANDLPVISKSGTLNSSEAWTAGNVYMINSDVVVPHNVTLTVQAGAIIKSAVSWSDSIKVNGGGTLNLEGTEANPIIFTSFQDDSAGGDSNTNGASTGSQNDYGNAIRADHYASVSINVSHTVFKYGLQTMKCYQTTGSIDFKDNILGSGMQLNGCGGVTLKRNVYNTSAAVALQLQSLDASDIAFAGIDRNTFLGSGIGRVVNLWDIIVEDGGTWELSGDTGAVYQISGLNVRGHLNVTDGAVIKIQDSSGFTMASTGVLNIEGSLAVPTKITSSKDDSIGGDTNNDGTLSQPQPNDYQWAVNMNSGGTVSVNYAQFYYGQLAVKHYCGSQAAYITISDSLLKSGIEMGGCNGSTLALKANQFDISSGIATSAGTNIDLSNIDLDGADRNTFTGSGRGRVIGVSGNVPTGTTWTIDGLSGAVIEVNSLAIVGTLNLNAGSIVKLFSNPISINSGGAIHARGAATTPVTFTSDSDDTVGGDTNGDGNSTIPGINDYVAALRPQTGALLSLENTVFMHGGYDIHTSCISGNPQSDIHIISADSTYDSGINLVGCGLTNLDFKRNTFQGSTKPAMSLTQVDMSKVTLSGNDRNNFTGSNRGKVIEMGSSFVPSGATWTVSGSSNAVLMSNTLTINGALILEAGAVMKLNSGGKIQIADNGTAHVQGSSGSNVIITSANDDSVAGDSNGDGTSSGNPGNFSNAFAWGANAAVSISYTSIKYASTALQANGSNATVVNTIISDSYTGLSTSGEAKVNASGVTMTGLSTGIYATQSSQVTYRGNFSNISDKAIRSCNWNQGCMVDAAYVDWGNAAGPISGNLACGAVMVDPWLYGSTSSESGMTKNCNGAYTPAEQLSTNAAGFQDAMSSRQISCDGGFQDACDAIDNAIACLSGAMSVAQSTAPWPLPPAGTAEQVNAAGGLILSGASDYLSSQATMTVTGFNFSLLTQALSVAGTITTMANAYNNCAP